MITEDYCSFELSKLLKKKGFKAELTTFYYSKGMFSQGNTFSFVNNELKINPDIILAPSLALAMKWLREVHKYFIEIRYSFEGESESGYEFKIRKIGEDDIGIWSLNDELYGSYEQAVDIAIKYCLENLI